MQTHFEIRAATDADLPILQKLIERSGVELSSGFYTPAQAQAITREVFGVDTQLVRDGTYFVIEDEVRIVACGGWSKRSTPYGGDQHKAAADRLLDPANEAAKIRAFLSIQAWHAGGLARCSCGTAPSKPCRPDSLHSN